MKRTALLASALLAWCGASAVAWADDWAKSGAGDKEFSQSVAICRRAVPLPKLDGRPAAADCSSSDLLYGIGRPTDPTAARTCAAREMAAGDNTTGGAATLATVYANGTGVERNLDVAIAYACRIDGAPYEMDGRVKHLARLKAKGPDAKPFDLCDDATSGLMQGFCAERDGDLADAKRQTTLKALTASLRGPERGAWERLESAEDKFVKASSDGEVDTSGTARGAMIVESEQANRKAFLTTLQALLAGKLAAHQPARDADRQLNRTYAKVMALKDVGAGGTVTKDGIRQAQRAWLAYRDAFLAFAKLRAPSEDDALASEITTAREKDLAAFIPR